MRERYQIDTITKRVDALTDEQRPIGILSRAARSLERYLGIPPAPPPPQDDGPAQRDGYFTDNRQLRYAINRLPIELTDGENEADRSIRAPRRELMLPTNEFLSPELLALIKQRDYQFAKNLITTIGVAKRRRFLEARQQAWWYDYRDTEFYSRDIFASDPTETYTIVADDDPVMKIYNFAAPLPQTDVAKLVSGMAVMSHYTEGFSRDLVPNVVVHDAFRPFYDRRSGQWLSVEGDAPYGAPVINVSRDARGYPGSVGQSWLEQVYTHEVSHQIDEAVGRRNTFRQYFDYKDSDRDGIIDAAPPKRSHAQHHAYDERTILSSQPNRAYGYENACEDLAVTGEEVPFGGRSDLPRKDAYNAVIANYIDRSRQHARAVPKPLPRDIMATRATGADMTMPSAPALESPLRIHVERPNRQRFNLFNH